LDDDFQQFRLNADNMLKKVTKDGQASIAHKDILLPEDMVKLEAFYADPTAYNCLQINKFRFVVTGGALSLLAGVPICIPCLPFRTLA